MRRLGNGISLVIVSLVIACTSFGVGLGSLIYAIEKSADQKKLHDVKKYMLLELNRNIYRFDTETGKTELLYLAAELPGFIDVNTLNFDQVSQKDMLDFYKNVSAELTRQRTLRDTIEAYKAAK